MPKVSMDGVTKIAIKNYHANQLASGVKPLSPIGPALH